MKISFNDPITAMSVPIYDDGAAEIAEIIQASCQHDYHELDFGLVRCHKCYAYDAFSSVVMSALIRRQSIEPQQGDERSQIIADLLAAQIEPSESVVAAVFSSVQRLAVSGVDV